MKKSVLLFVCGVIASAPALGTQQAHVHGELELQLVQEGKKLSMRLQSPLANIVGFEYQPVEAEEKWKLNQAVSALSSADWLKVEGQTCKTETVDVSYTWQKQTDHDVHEHHDHGEHKHHDHDEHEHHHDHDGQEHHDEHKHHSTHASVYIDYELLCDEEKMAPITVELFEHFPAIERIDAQWINESGQGSAALTPSKNLIRP